MLDVHPPEHTPHTWRDFLIHIATIVVGLVIAVGLEQGVEAVHHHHQRRELIRQVRTEAEHNIVILQGDLDRNIEQLHYLNALRIALQTGSPTASGIDVHGVPTPGISVVITSPTRGTWQAAQAAGLIALLPSGQAKLYARVDFNAAEELSTEAPLNDKLGQLNSECESAGFNHASTAVSHLSLSERNLLVYKLDQVGNELALLGSYISISIGGDQAIVAGASSLDQMYPYQEASLDRYIRYDDRPDAARNFYGGLRNLGSRTNLYTGSRPSK